MTNTNDHRKDVPITGGGRTDDPHARFPKQAERLRRGVRITRLIGEYTALRHSKKHLTGDCPLHATPTKTLKVYPRTNTFRCLFCGLDGDAITFLKKVEGLTYGQALEALETMYYADDDAA